MLYFLRLLRRFAPRMTLRVLLWRTLAKQSQNYLTLVNLALVTRLSSLPVL